MSDAYQKWAEGYHQAQAMAANQFHAIEQHGSLAGLGSLQGVAPGQGLGGRAINPLYWGIDPAEKGSDQTTVVVREGMKVLDPQEVATLAARLMRENRELRERVAALEAQNAEMVRRAMRNMLAVDMPFAEPEPADGLLGVLGCDDVALREFTQIAGDLLLKTSVAEPEPLPQSEADRIWEAVKAAACS